MFVGWSRTLNWLVVLATIRSYCSSFVYVLAVQVARINYKKV